MPPRVCIRRVTTRVCLPGYNQGVPRVYNGGYNQGVPRVYRGGVYLRVCTVVGIPQCVHHGGYTSVWCTIVGIHRSCSHRSAPRGAFYTLLFSGSMVHIVNTFSHVSPVPGLLGGGIPTCWLFPFHCLRAVRGVSF